MKSSPTPEPIKIGIPSNNRISQDCRPLFELLNLNGPEDKQTSPYIPGAIFRQMRVNDIAQFLRKGIFDMGILGDDTALENGLVDTKLPYDATQKDRGSIYIGENKRINAPKKAIDLNLPATDLVLFGKPKDLDGVLFGYQMTGWAKIATPYPRTAERILSRLYGRYPRIIPNEGKTESIVANNDGGALLGYDVVRTGDTLKRFGLKPWRTTVKSYPGLWESAATNDERRARSESIRNALREIFASYNPNIIL